MNRIEFERLTVNATALRDGKGTQNVKIAIKLLMIDNFKSVRLGDIRNED